VRGRNIVKWLGLRAVSRESLAAGLSTVLLGLASVCFASEPALAAPPSSATPAVIGGAAASQGQFPYAVYLEANYVAGGSTNTAWCTGSLITPTIVLTAAHCVYDDATGFAILPEDFLVILGLADVSGNTVANQRAVTKVVPDPNFNPVTVQNDAALLILSSPAPAGAVPLPLATTADAALYAAGQPATVLGYGHTSAAPGSLISLQLQFGANGIESNADCGAADTFPYHPAVEMCAAAPGFVPSICNGDSGGPLVVNSATGPVEVGIASHAISGTCGVGPSYFARASSIQPWVASVIAGTPAPPSFVPPFAGITPTATLHGDEIDVTFAPPAADFATLVFDYVLELVDSTGAVVGSPRVLPSTQTTVSFPALKPGIYGAAVVVVYTEGTSAIGLSSILTLKPPSNTVTPGIEGTPLAGRTLTCTTGTWSWPGVPAFSAQWLRNGVATTRTASTYRVTSADAGKRLSCQVTLKTSSGITAAAKSRSLLAEVKLSPRVAPRLAGTGAVGSKPTCLAGTWKHSGSLKVSYRWLRNGNPISGAPGAKTKRTVGSADAGHALSCRVTVATSSQTASRTTHSISVS
jgi:Trypsin